MTGEHQSHRQTGQADGWGEFKCDGCVWSEPLAAATHLWRRIRLAIAEMSNSMILKVACVSCVSVLLATGCSPRQVSAQRDMEQLQGTWRLVYQQINGKQLPDEKTARILHGKMAFSGERIHYRVEIQGFDFQFAYKLYPDQEPKGIDLTLTDSPDKQGVGRTMSGIYLLDGGNLKICYNPTNRPAEFVAAKGTHSTLIVLKRESESP